MKKMFKEISKDLGVKITTFDIPYERIKQNIRLDLNNCKSKSTILEHITEGKNKPPKKIEKQILKEFKKEELQQKLSDILPILDINNDPRLKYLLKDGIGPYCKIVVAKKHKQYLNKSKGVYCFYNKKTFKPLYFGTAGTSYKRLMQYFSITPGNCMFNGQGTSVRINKIINNFLNDGMSIGIAIIPMINSLRVDIRKEEEELIYKFRNSHPFWNKNKS